MTMREIYKNAHGQRMVVYASGELNEEWILLDHTYRDDTLEYVAYLVAERDDFRGDSNDYWLEARRILYGRENVTT